MSFFEQHPNPAFMKAAMVIEASVGESTRIQYQYLLNAMLRLGFTCDFDGLSERFCRFDEVSSDSLANTISAVNWDLSRKGKADLAAFQVRYLRKLLRGRRMILGGRTVKGAIDLEKLIAMLAWLKTQGVDDQMRWNIQVCWATGLRTSQIPELRKRHFVKMPDGSYVLRIRKIHDPTQADRSKEKIIQLHVHSRLTAPLNEYLETYGDNEPICPGWVQLRVNKLIRRAAIALGWPPELTWQGAHQLRHGVLTEVARTEGIDAARLISGHVKPPVQEGSVMVYVTDEAERVALALAAKQQKKAVAKGIKPNIARGPKQPPRKKAKSA